MTQLARKSVAATIAVAGIALAVHGAYADDTADGLLADPHRLAVVQKGCKTNAPWATEALCKVAAQAIRRRFRGEGVPYTPHRFDPFPDQPTPNPSQPPVSAGKPDASHTRSSTGAAPMS